MRIAVNAGHGPKDNGLYDPGAVGPSGLLEAEQNLKVAKSLLAKLQAVNWACLLIHDGDLDDVIKKNNTWGASYFISIHANAATNPRARGVETYAWLPGGQAEKLALVIQKELVSKTGQVDRGVKFANFRVLKYTNCPAVLVEAGFISNPETESLMREGAFAEKVAQAIFNGLLKICNK
ncbi:MAG: N-acetylmuramoyl-L-alanine amidase [Peptococcaceae bacterium]|nr:N-acetylmuramoyl-L-alanine amidase [Peptococcaceae bacterium]